MTHPNRRQMLRSAGAGLAALALSPFYGAARTSAADAGFTLPDLPYPYDALEPSIDKETMTIHHDKHHAAYVKNLNDALKDHPDFLKMDVVDVLKNVDKLPKDIQQKVINNGGGHLNHSLFWTWMAPKDKGGGGEPTGDLGKAIAAAFGDLGKFKDKMKAAALGRFGSGWAWLVYTVGTDKLEVVSTANQDEPAGTATVLGVDVWEHAYYLKYHQDRGKYVDAWWDVVNWKTAADRFDHAKKVS